MGNLNLTAEVNKIKLLTLTETKLKEFPSNPCSKLDKMGIFCQTHKIVSHSERDKINTEHKMHLDDAITSSNPKQKREIDIKPAMVNQQALWIDKLYPHEIQKTRTKQLQKE